LYIEFENGEYVTICLYVDDMLIFSTYNDIVSRTKLFLGFESLKWKTRVKQILF